MVLQRRFRNRPLSSGSLNSSSNRRDEELQKLDANRTFRRSSSSMSNDLVTLVYCD